MSEYRSNPQQNQPTQQFQPQFPPGGPPPMSPAIQPKKRRRWVPFVAYPAAVLLGVVIGASGSGDAGTAASSSPEATVTVTASAAPKVAATSAPVEPTYGKPTKADFKLTVKTLSKQCFGSAGCNLTYRILISYTGPDLEPGKEYEVLYQVRGGEDGPVENKFTVQGDESSVDSEEMVSTRSSKVKLTAVVTDVL